MRQLFGNRHFRAFFLGLHSFGLGYTVGAVAISWQIYSLRHRPFDLGLVGLTLFFPSLLLALPAGVLADRFDRRLIALIVAGVEGIAFLMLGALTLIGSKSLVAYFAVIAVIGVGEAIAAPADRALLVGVVPAQLYLRASAFSSSLMQLIRIAGPAIAGALIAFSTPIAFAVATLFNIVAMVGYWLLPELRAEAHDSDVPVLAMALEGVKFIFKKRIVLSAISLDLFAVFFGGATALLPVFAVSILHVGPTGFGALRAAPAVGAGLVGAFLARHPLERRAGPLLLWCVTGFGIATITFGLSKNLLLSLAALALTGAFDMVSVVIRNGLVQLGTPDPLRGRVNAIENIFIGASNELGEFESGTVAAVLGSVPSVVIGGAATLVVVSVWSLLFPELRIFDRFLEPEVKELGESILGSP